MDKKPNLFRFATSELSQDAFLGWLISWADLSGNAIDPALHRVARALIDRMLDIAGIEKPADYENVQVRLQYMHVDLLVSLDDDVLILIEDKVETQEHSNQLSNYVDRVSREHPQKRIACVYFKTGEQASYKAVRDAGFKVFNRQMFLDVLREAREAGVRNDIFTDYLDYLEEVEGHYSSFRTLGPAEQWSGRAWQGLLKEVREHLQDGHWDYVANPAGGFMGLWWRYRDGIKGEKVYLQLEDEKLCFKIESNTDDASERRRLRRLWHEAIQEAAQSSDLRVEKPQRFGSGYYMTVSLHPDYRRFHADDTLDLDATMQVLREAERIHERAVSQMTNS